MCDIFEKQLAKWRMRSWCRGLCQWCGSSLVLHSLMFLKQSYLSGNSLSPLEVIQQNLFNHI